MSPLRRAELAKMISFWDVPVKLGVNGDFGLVFCYPKCCKLGFMACMHVHASSSSFATFDGRPCAPAVEIYMKFDGKNRKFSLIARRISSIKSMEFIRSPLEILCLFMMGIRIMIAGFPSNSEMTLVSFF